MAKQILFIHGAGNKRRSYGSGKLIAELQEKLGSDYEVVSPDMPDPDSPHYLAWRDQIKQELTILNEDIILIGHSVGGSVLMKLLAEEEPLRRIRALFLVASPYWGKDEQWQAAEYFLPEDFAEELPPISQITLYHSREDGVVPFEHLGFYKEKIPHATIRILDGDDHYFTSGLPELVHDVKNL